MLRQKYACAMCDHWALFIAFGDRNRESESLDRFKKRSILIERSFCPIIYLPYPDV